MLYEVMLLLFVPAIIFLYLGLTTEKPLLTVYGCMILIILSLFIMIEGISIPIGWVVG